VTEDDLNAPIRLKRPWLMYFRFSDPKEIGTNQLHLNYIFSNAGKTPVFIEDISLDEVFYQRNGNVNTVPNLDICKNWKLQTPSFVAFEPSEIQSKAEFFPAEFFPEERLYSAFRNPKITYIDNVQSPFPSTNIEAGAQRAISAVYEMDAIDWSKSDVVLLCPIVRFFDSSGRPSTAVCDGFQGDQIPTGKDEPKGTRTTPAGVARLLPTSASNCRISPF